MEKDLVNKISIGASPLISLGEYKIILKKYKKYIQSLYFSPPYDEKFQSRLELVEAFKNPKNISKILDVLELFKNEGIEIDCVLNRPSLNSDMIMTYVNDIKQLNPDQITCLENHIDIVKREFPDAQKIYSFNNDFRISNLKHVSHDFDTIVVGKYFLRNTDYLKEIYASGFGLKLLVNNGCAFNCLGCKTGSKQCVDTFEKNLKKHSPEYLYAMQSFYPYELHSLIDKLDIPIESIKISNRTSDYNYLDRCLHSYIYDGNDNFDIIQEYEDFKLFGKQANLYKYMKKFDSEKILSIKRRL